MFRRDQKFKGLRLFELISGLKVNFSKSLLYGWNIQEDVVEEGAALLGCEKGGQQFSYLGMKIGINPHAKDNWSWLIQKIKNRIACWDGRNISLGGRATLVQSVLSAIPIYALSFYLLPNTSLNQIIRVQRAFLWGGDEHNTKIPWVSWSEICKNKEDGGLGIRDIGLFNKVLVEKWVWRLLEERESLWVKIIESKYGILGREVAGRAWSKASLWWRDVFRLFWGSDGGGMREDFEREIGDGRDTVVWEDIWVDGMNLKTKFPRLYRLSLQKTSRISEMGGWVNGV